ncbi:MAG: hypothetical protein ACJAS1_001464 [Oleiphilaceae bacterium]|jgi:hypothetical protein
MREESNNQNIFHLVGVVVASSQLFETVFILTAKFALKQPDLAVFKDIKPTAFKQAVNALLNELLHNKKISEELASRIKILVENRHKIIHRAFLECGWPAPLSEEKERLHSKLCIKVIAESQALSVVLMDILLPWMENFPETEKTAKEYKQKFVELSERVNTQSEQVVYLNENA